MNKILLIFISSLMMASCNESEKLPENLLPEDTYMQLLGELYLAHNLRDLDIENIQMTDSVRQELFSKYGTTREQFTESHHYYQRDLNGQIRRVDKLRNLIRDEAKHIGTTVDSIKKAPVSQDADSLSQ